MRLNVRPLAIGLTAATSDLCATVLTAYHDKHAYTSQIFTPFRSLGSYSEGTDSGFI